MFVVAADFALVTRMAEYMPNASWRGADAVSRKMQRMTYVRPAIKFVDRPGSERRPGFANKTPTEDSTMPATGFDAFAAAMNCCTVTPEASSAMLNSCECLPAFRKRNTVRPAGSSLGALNA